MEGIVLGDAVLTLRLVRIEADHPQPIFPDLEAATLLHFDSVLVTVNYIDLTGHTPYTQPFQLRQIPEANEENPGVHIRRNGDDDNGNGIPDFVDTNVTNENDLILVTIATATVAPNGLRFELERGSDDIRVWTSPNKGIQLTATNNPGQITLNQVPANIWVEWVTPGTAPAESSLDIRLIDNISNNLVATDTLVFRPFTSIVIVLGGEDQQPADPVLEPGNHGTFQSAIDLYIENYDVHMYNEDLVGWEVDLANAIPYHEVVNAIQNRGVTQVAIYGYSHGGGSTYELAWALNENVIGNLTDITLPFTLPFTSYIDAITHSWIGAENRRPLLN